MDYTNIKITDATYPCAQLTPEGFLLVEGIENWLSNLIEIGFQDGFAMMQDSKTGGKFLIKKV